MAAHVFVVLSLYRSQPEYLRAQIDSVLAQDHRELTLLIVPDGQDAGSIGSISDNRVQVVPHATRKGIAGNFLRGLSQALALSGDPSDLFAFCDQDDVWMPNKLSTLIAALQKHAAHMAYCDARIIAADGSLVAKSLFDAERRQPHRDLADLLIVNDVSGMAMLFTRDCAERAMRSPPPSDILHDWWVALIAKAIGATVFVEEPLVEYRHHAGNVVGPALDRPPKRRFLSRAYRDMCMRQVALRKEILAALPVAPEFGKIISIPTLLRRLIPFGAQRARAAIRLIFGLMLGKNHA